MSSFEKVCVVVGAALIVVAIVTTIAVWLSRHAAWVIAVLWFIAVGSFIAMLGNATLAWTSHYAPSQPSWLIVTFTVSLIMAFFSSWAVGLDA